MTRYRGDNRIGSAAPDPRPGYALRVQVAPAELHLFMALFQGHGHLAYPAEVDPKLGLLIFHTTPECLPELREVLRQLAIPVTFLP
ncbi:MAG: DUF4911 domain-containing protein [Solirubrobacterales bacterium]